MKRHGLAVLLVLLIPAFAFASGGREDESFSYPDIDRLEVRGVFLNVEISGDNGSVVSLRSDLSEGAFFMERNFTVKHRVDGSTLRVWVETEGFFSGGNGSLFFRVPSQTEVAVETASGDVRISGISTSTVTAKSASGRMTLRDIDADIEAGTISGNLTARKLSGGVSLSTISGTIDMNSVRGQLSIGSISGSIRGDGVHLEESSAFKTVSGAIELDLENALEELSYDLSTVSGKLTVGSVRATRGLVMGSGSLTLRGETVSGYQTYR